MRRTALLLSTGLLALTLMACQQNPEKAEKKAELAVCENLAAVGDALANVQALTPKSTVGDAEKAQQALSSAIASLETAQQGLQKARVGELRDQLKTFNKEVEKVAKQKKLTLAEAAQQLRSKAQPVIAARQEALAEIECIEEPAAAGKAHQG
jgi:alanyl-tRNA synthetase